MQEKELCLKDNDGNELNVLITHPNYRVLQDAQMIYNLKIAELIRKAANGKDSLLLKSQLDDYLEKIGVWTKEDKISIAAKQVELRSLESLLQKGGMKLSEGRNIAVRMRQLRSDIFSLLSKRMQFDSVTIEAQADQYKFMHVLINTVIDKKNDTLLFSSIDEYIKSEHCDYVREIAKNVAMMFFGYEEKDMEKLPENTWLKKYKFVNDKNRLINKNGKLVDTDGRLIDENGRYVNDNGDFVDANGSRVDEFGNLLVDESMPYIDDDTGNAIILNGYTEPVNT